MDEQRNQPEPTDEAEVEGHRARYFNKDDAPRATGEPQAGDEAEVEGHLHPDLAQDFHAARHRELLSKAEQERRANSVGKERDGGMLDKISRFARRED